MATSYKRQRVDLFQKQNSVELNSKVPWVISFKKFMTSTQGLEKTKVKELLTKDNEAQKIVVE